MSIKDKVIVFTGRISKPRHEFQKLVEKNGGIPSDSVTKKTDYLIVGEAPGSKLAMAALLGIKTLTEQEFLNLLKEPSTEETDQPLTQEELSEIESHLVILRCDFCNSEYKQWDSLPNTNTCPVCETLCKPECPHCKDGTSIYITDFNLYVCFSCSTWFKAPYSSRAKSERHVHLFAQSRTLDNSNVEKTCTCGAKTTLTALDQKQAKRNYEEAPLKVQQRQHDYEIWLKSQEELAKRTQLEKLFLEHEKILKGENQ
jgi:hypothetical protein